jgi:hypothetical protein
VHYTVSPSELCSLVLTMTSKKDSAFFCPTSIVMDGIKILKKTLKLFFSVSI